ncbi:hypothetical protein DYB32_009064 [Aphanomyces invadans]|uniref:NADH-ubiquinone oxidoreductase chain 3 n=1 Tax=Aphanomyces invadans TaxID=157072 RepID=A0A3R7A3G0_9STRA|nr:hypothetical protein DYB32_009064 [Aphanomyces invadans]
MKTNYSNIFIFLRICLVLSSIIFVLSFILIQQKDDLEKLTAYECGFDPYDDARKVFDVKSYLVISLLVYNYLKNIDHLCLIHLGIKNIYLINMIIVIK